MSTIIKPVQLLYHGTSFKNSRSIQNDGIKPVNYNKVYLTADINVAYHYAKALQLDKSDYSGTLICVVDSEQMYKDGFVFTHEATNGEYTVDRVPSKYVLPVVIETEDELSLLSHCISAQYS